MTYYNDLNTGGADIDGSPMETVALGAISWEMVTGTQGTLIHVGVLDTDIPGLGFTSYYLDDDSPPVTQCTGDDYAYGSSGLFVDQPIPNTDPYLGSAYRFEVARTVYVEGPDKPVSLAETRQGQVAAPLVATVSPVTAVEPKTVDPGYHLGQNFPNPFHSRTSVDIRVPAGMRARVTVYDVKGNLIKVLADGLSGDRSIAWDGYDKFGRRVASGVYFYRLETKLFNQTRKMVLLD
jgi:hypothetical protein